MKWSMFNVTKKYGDRIRIFNTLTRATVEMEECIYESVLTDNCADQINALEELGIVVPEKIDEFKLFIYWYNKRITQKKFFAITYIPTYECIFGCKYCIEGKVNIKKEKIDYRKIMAYIAAKISSEKYEIIDLVFFGGEPLLALDEILNVSQFMRELAKRYEKKLKMSIVTNGYLLNERNVKKLVDNEIETFQVTIDGSKEVHDTRRCLKNGIGTYDVIVNNLNKMISRYENIEIILNLNYDETNYKDIVRFLEKAPFDLNKFFIKINPIKNSCKNINSIGKIIHKKDAMYIYSQMKAKGLYSRESSINEYGPCLKRIRNSIIVDCYGDIYKCVFGVGNEDNIIGNIEKDENIITYMNDLTMNSKCSECAILPICMTGCPRMKKELAEWTCRKEEIYVTIVEPILDNMI